MFSSHKDVVWQLVYHPTDDMLLSVSADGSVKLWKPFDAYSNYFDSIEQCTNHCLMGSFLYKKDTGLIEIPTSASWVQTHPNMLVISYRRPIIGLFDRVTGRSRGVVNVEVDHSQYLHT